MNRQEALKKLKKLDEQFRDEIGWDIRDEYLESLDELKEYLEKTITLAEFLNLKEDVLYTKTCPYMMLWRCKNNEYR